MKIVTVNVPESYLEAIEKLIGESGLYPSRSELIRVAVREFLLKELKMAKNMDKYNEPEFDEAKEVEDKNFVRVPIESKNEKDEPVIVFKTFKVLKVLDSPAIEKKPQTKPKHKKAIPLGRNFPNDSFNNLESEPKFEADPEFRKKFTEGL